MRPAAPPSASSAPGPRPLKALLIVAVCVAMSACGGSSDHHAASTTTSSTTASATTPTSVACPTHAYGMQSSDLADQIVATNTDCAVAERVVAAAPDRSHGSASYQAEDFTCTAGAYAQPTGGGKGWFPYACRDGRGAAVSFNRY